MSIEDDIWDDIDEAMPSKASSESVKITKPTVKKRHLTARDVAEQIAIRKAKGMDVQSDRIAFVVRCINKGYTLEGCNPECHMGVWVDPMNTRKPTYYARMCKRCRGKGHLTDKLRLNYERYLKRKHQRKLSISYVDHNEDNEYVLV